MIQQAIERLWGASPDVFSFRNEADKAKVIAEIEKRFALSGNVIRNLNTGAEVSSDLFESAVFSASSDFLKVRGRGRYIPAFADNRTTEQRIAHKLETEKVVDFIFDRMGLSFKGEAVGDFTLRQLVKGSISEHLLFEAGGPNGEVVFRKLSEGMLSREFSIDEVVGHFTVGLIDHNRTESKRAELKLAFQKKEAEKLGYSEIANVPRDKQNILLSRTDAAFRESHTPVTRRALPKQEPREIEQEFEKRALFKTGLPNKQAATLSHLNAIRSYTTDKLNRLNSLPKVPSELTDYQTPAQEWGFETTNNQGFHLPNDLL